MGSFAYKRVPVGRVYYSRPTGCWRTRAVPELAIGKNWTVKLLLNWQRSCHSSCRFIRSFTVVHTEKLACDTRQFQTGVTAHFAIVPDNHITVVHRASFLYFMTLFSYVFFLCFHSSNYSWAVVLFLVWRFVYKSDCCCWLITSALFSVFIWYLITILVFPFIESLKTTKIWCTTRYTVDNLRYTPLFS